MNRRLYFFLGLTVLLVLLNATSVTAQGPTPGAKRAPNTALGTSFSYQGQLRKNGSPVTNTCNFQFSLWDSLSNPTGQLGATQTIPSVSIANGLFTTTLNTAGEFGANAFNGDARWLAIATQCAGDVSYVALNPRQAVSPAPFAFALPGLYTQQNATSPNLIGGYSGNWVTSGVNGATIGGGGRASGYENTVTDDYGTVGGGVANRAGDGAGTTGDKTYATVGGGSNNVASGYLATIGGGSNNIASANSATVSGGATNNANNFFATIGGGWINTASGLGATIPGGVSNTAQGDYSSAAGYRAKANHKGTFVWGDSTNADFVSTADNQFLIRASNGVGIGTNSPAAKLHVVGNGYFDFGATGSVNVATPQGTPGIIGMASNGNRRDIFFSNSGLSLSVSNTPSTGGVARGIFIDQNTANVGIGTTSPITKLDVAGTTATNVLEIRGGSDLAEKFDVANNTIVEPGTLMVIDDEHTGKLKPSEQAYDTKVAGITSGAGGVQPGLTLHQEGVMEGNIIVAIAGRVYVKAEAFSSPIKPGDLLTTSSIPGYAMKATDRARAQGATIGKAMSELKEGTGLVLVLVNLQ